MIISNGESSISSWSHSDTLKIRVQIDDAFLPSELISSCLAYLLRTKVGPVRSPIRTLVTRRERDRVDEPFNISWRLLLVLLNPANSRDHQLLGSADQYHTI